MVKIRIKKSQTLGEDLMTLKNVQKIEAQEIHQKTWFQKFRGKLAPVAISSGSLVAMSANAADTAPDFLATATSSMSGILTSLGALFVVGIGITLLIMAYSISKGGVKKA